MRAGAALGLAALMDLELGQLDLRYAALRVAAPQRDAELCASLLAEGQRSPVLVVAVASDPNRFIVIDGYARVRAQQRLGNDIIRVQVLDLGEAEALLWHHLLQSGPRRHALEDGWLVSELIETHGWTATANRSRAGTDCQLGVTTISVGGDVAHGGPRTHSHRAAQCPGSHEVSGAFGSGQSGTL